MAADVTLSSPGLQIPEWGDLGKSLAHLLMRRPRAADVCRYLVLSVQWPETPNAAVLLKCQDDGYIEVIGSFGYPREWVDAYRRQSLFDALPLTTAARCQETVALFDAIHVQNRYPDLVEQVDTSNSAAPGPLIAVPLLSDLGSVGVLGMSFSQDVSPAGPTVPALEALAPLLGLYVELTSPSGLLPTPAAASLGNSEVDLEDFQPTPGKEGLSKRQLRVLGMLAKKMSNREIALALDYSVSTIRLDTMAIFRYLGVGSRREAVDEARRRGIIVAG